MIHLLEVGIYVQSSACETGTRRSARKVLLSASCVERLYKVSARVEGRVVINVGSF